MNRVWDGSECNCKVGYIESNGRCIEQCKENQLIDSNGVCYYCPVL